MYLFFSPEDPKIVEFLCTAQVDDIETTKEPNATSSKFCLQGGHDYPGNDILGAVTLNIKPSPVMRSSCPQNTTLSNSAPIFEGMIAESAALPSQPDAFFKHRSGYYKD
ncbi:hypothetical protein Bca52824_064255 [Brassica carinata]|uniref:Uncharacterized protein n=1 Tax=Brassica carinata TaxID=52824 RepID=A0A8X7U7Z1_BRACI|nr:hypothetical protein Bca52824_064255 [Brassica carinata]